jgi:indole-3-glycerol phosphate synthase
MCIAAEFKRASPSKGDINIGLDCADQCLLYAEAGAKVVSVLTEFRHFKGTLGDMKKARIATQLARGREGGRPAILRKDFIFDRYFPYFSTHSPRSFLLLCSLNPFQNLPINFGSHEYNSFFL